MVLVSLVYKQAVGCRNMNEKHTIYLYTSLIGFNFLHMWTSEKRQIVECRLGLFNVPY